MTAIIIISEHTWKDMQITGLKKKNSTGTSSPHSTVTYV